MCFPLFTPVVHLYPIGYTMDECRARLRAVALDVVTLVSVRVVLWIDVARSAAPDVFEASIVGPVVVVRVAVRGGIRALYVGPVREEMRRPGALLERGRRG